MSINTIIFDFGNVIAHFDYKIAAGRIGQPLGVSGADLMAKVMSLDFHPLLMDLESGRIDEWAFLAELKHRLGLPQEIQQLAADWADIFSANQPIHNLAQSLKNNGYKLVLGSNTNAIHARQFQNQFAGLLNQFEALVMSHQVGAMKPAALFYERCHQAAGEPPEHCVFIDDMPENVEGARAVGLHALHYCDTDRLIQDLAALGVRTA